MCIKCELRKIFGDIKDPNEILIGVVSPQLLAAFNANTKAVALAEIEVDQLVLNGRRAMLENDLSEEAVAELQKPINEQQAADYEKYDAIEKGLWLRVYAELAITNHDRAYSINTETGEVTTRRRRGDEGETPNVH
jgi:hypothetical protein